MNRRSLLMLLGIGTGSAAQAVARSRRPANAAPRPRGSLSPELPFRPVPTPLPLPGDGLAAAEQRRHYAQVSLVDRLVVPEGYRADLLAVWGDPLGTGTFGYNNDHLAFLALAPDEALLTVNFEYISARPWAEGLGEARGLALPLEPLRVALADRDGRVDATALKGRDPLLAMVRAVAAAALEDLGIGVAGLRRGAEGRWQRQPGRFDRRITGLSGLEDPAQLLRASGPAAAVFRAPQRLGHDDGLGDRIIGTFANCAGGTTPWGTVLSAEENVQNEVCEEVFADGSSPAPSRLPFRWDGRRLRGLGNPFGLAGNKYGWIVEVDPRRPRRPPVKHTALGRFRHEAVAVKAEAGQPLVVYSGCDRHGGHLYRYVSAGRIEDPGDSSNSALFTQGRLEVARFSPDGRGRWIPLLPGTRLDPQRPSHYRRWGLSQPTLVPHHDRSRPGAIALGSDAEVAEYRERFATLAALYPGEAEARLGAILIDAHLAANAAGATATARPEDTVIDPSTGDLLIAFTAGGGEEKEGRADPAIFSGPAGESSWPHGWVMRLSDASPESGSFGWRMVAVGGAPWEGGLGFANPDNLEVDRSGNVWIVTDRSSRPAPGDPFGNNSCWVLPKAGPARGQALCFATGPMECELTGPCFDDPQHTLFLAVQHPGEVNGTRAAKAGDSQRIPLVDRSGTPFTQERLVPQGSNWPSGVPGRPPRPGIVAIQRAAGGELLS
ncbi:MULTISPECIES: PhoX family protein [Aphanothece]|uniref:PhoX family protein n=1 Tax=Aphanothece TaxID=1121 RepID=UPI0039851604